MSLAAGTLALSLALAGCGGAKKKDSDDRGSDAATAAPAEKVQMQLGDSSEPQEVSTAKEKAEFRVTPTKVVTGTHDDFKGQGFDEKDIAGKAPAYVWATFQHVGGDPIEAMPHTDLGVKTASGAQGSRLITLMGTADMRDDCTPASGEEKYAKGQSRKLCTIFLVPEDSKVDEVLYSRGWHAEPLSWTVKP